MAVFPKSIVIVSTVHHRPIETNEATINLGLRCFWETQPTSEMFKGPITGDEPSWDMLINVYSKR